MGPVTSPPKTDSHRAVSGSVWSVVGLLATQGVRLAGNLVLAYLLFPEAFGVVALVNIFIRGAEMFSDFGIWRSVTQNKAGAESRYLNTAWSLQAIRGVVLWLFTCALATPFARLYEEPMLVPYLWVGGFVLVLRGLESPAILLLRRQLRLRELALFELFGQVCALAFMIAWAAWRPEVWSLVGGAVFGAFVRLVSSHVWFREQRPRFEWDASALRDLVHLGKWIFLSSIVTFVAGESDRLLLGKLVSRAELGIYGIALGYTSLAVMLANRLMNMVLFPIMSRRQDDPENVVATFLEVRRYVLTFSVGLCAAIVVGAPVFFDVLYDERYFDAGRYAQWLVGLAWAAILAAGIDLVPLAMGDSRVQFVGNLVRSTGFVLGGLGFQLGGIAGLIFGFALAWVLSQLYLVTRLPSRSAQVLRQSVYFTVGLAVYVFGSLILLDWLGARAGTLEAHAARGGLALVALAISAQALWRNLRARTEAA